MGKAIVFVEAVVKNITKEIVLVEKENRVEDIRNRNSTYFGALQSI